TRTHRSAPGDTHGPDHGHITRSSTLQKAPPDELPMHLVGSLPNLRDLGIAHQALDTMILAVAIPSQKLDGLGGHAHRQIRCAQLEDRGSRTEVGLSAIHGTSYRPQE